MTNHTIPLELLATVTGGFDCLTGTPEGDVRGPGKIKSDRDRRDEVDPKRFWAPY